MSLATCVGSSAGVGAIEVELYTLGPGDHLFNKFGHVAICLVDPTSEAGRCYNFGTADFSRPASLGWEVLRGRARFWVEVTRRNGTVADFGSQNRDVYRQIIPLSEAETQRLVGQLEQSSAPDNRTYKYHHFRDNCSTKPRDLLNGATGGRLESERNDTGASLRDSVREGFAFSPLLLLGSDLLLGSTVDRIPSGFEQMFLPTHLRASVADRLGAPAERIFERVAPDTVSWSLPVIRGSLVLATLVLGAWILRSRRTSLGWVALLLLGGIGIVIWTVALISPLEELRFNQNLALFWPTDAVLAFFRPERRITAGYLRVRGVVLSLAGAALAVGYFNQPIGPYWFSVGILLLGSYYTLIQRRPAAGPASLPGAAS